MIPLQVELLHVVNRIVIPVKEPARILIVPWGNVESTAGDMVVDEESAAQVVELFGSRRLDVPVDIEHQTVGGKFAAPDGKAPAMAWITGLEAVEDEGIYANVEWVEEGAELVRSKKYRYISPVLLVHKISRRVVMLHSVALTNKPAITGMPPVVNKDGTETPMDAKFERAMWFLNLETTATEEEILMKLEEFLAQLRELAGAAESAGQEAVLSALKQKLGDATAAGELRATVCKAVELEVTVKDAEIVTAVNKLKTPAPTSESQTDVVPKAEYDALATAHKDLSEKVGKLESRVNSGDAASRIKESQDAGLLTDAMLQPNAEDKNYFRTLAEDPEQWEAWMERAPKVAPETGRVVNSTTKPGAGGGGGGGGRVAVINAAKAEYEGEETLQVLCSKEAYVEDQLREAKLTDTLTDKEKELLVAT